MTLKTVQSLQGLKATQLRQSLRLIGAKQTGNKVQLAERLFEELRLPVSASQHVAKQGLPGRTILSIDMGIKNLAYCVVNDKFQENGLDASRKNRFHISAWERLNVLEDSRAEGSVIEGDFSPASLVPVALRLIKDIFLPLKPTNILIERQRFRTGGASAVQEWTLRVNTLEAMLWAVLGTLRNSMASENVTKVQIHAVSPSRVTAFWLPGERRVRKKEKVHLVTEWLHATNNQVLDINIDPKTGISKEMFTGAKTTAKSLTKLDDLTDCLLQAVAWSLWESNRHKLHNLSVEQLMEISRFDHRVGLDWN
jgi:cruciform cutting endonuclease 1